MDGSFRRALSIAAESQSSKPLITAFKDLSIVEERICNEVAARVLVPDNQLHDLVGEWRKSCDGCDSVFGLIRRVADEFQVSWSCALRRLSVTATEAIQESLGADFCFLLVAESAQKGALQARRELRILDAIWPQSLNGCEVRPLFPGIAAKNLGTEFDVFLRSKFDSDGQSTRGDLTLRLETRMKPRGHGQFAMNAVALKGSWRQWTQVPQNRLAICGQIATNAAVESTESLSASPTTT